MMVDDKLLIDKLVESFYRVFDNRDQRNVSKINFLDCFHPQAMITKHSKSDTQIFDLEAFIEPRIQLLNNRDVEDFYEYEIAEQTVVYEGMTAHRYSKYGKSGLREGVKFQSEGDKLFQFIKFEQQWKIIALLWWGE